MIRPVLAAALVLAAVSAAAADAPASRLAAEKSPYLVEHSTDKVDWSPWGAAAIARAKREQKPIFLSIGYAACHWCHVMKKESFSDAEVAQLLNSYFVPVLVDREEHPDVDAAFITFVELMNDGRAGWPANLILSPELEPLAAASYMPRDALSRLLVIASNQWATPADRKKLREDAAKVIAAARDLARVAPAEAAAAPALRSYIDFAKKNADAANGGFGTAPKFPQPLLLEVLLREAMRTHDSDTGNLVLNALRAMANSSMYDQIGGGFHRYTTDAAWRKPHYEKMLYDQALLANVYLEAWQITREPLFRDVATRTLDYLLRDMKLPEAGAFFSAQDSDSIVAGPRGPETREGAFYEWTRASLTNALGAKFAEIAAYRYGIDEQNALPFSAHSEAMTRKEFNLSADQTADILEGIRAKMLDLRLKRPAPYRDDKLLAGWNGLTISALARAGAALGDKRYLEGATAAARYIESKLWNPTTKKLMRFGAVDGLAEDYAFVVSGMLDLYEASADVRWLKLAIELQRQQDARFWTDAEGRYTTGTVLPAALASTLEDNDGATPSVNSVAAMNLARLAEVLADDKMRARSATIVKTYSARIAAGSMPALGAALSRSLSPAKQIVIAGNLRDDTTRTLMRTVFAPFLPNRVVLYPDPLLPQLKDVKPPQKPHAASVYLCQHFVCELPIEDPAQLAKVLAE